jgi:hypothetical protein
LRPDHGHLYEVAGIEPQKSVRPHFWFDSVLFGFIWLDLPSVVEGRARIFGLIWFNLV